MNLTPYKPNQGKYARGSAGTGILAFSLFASWRFAQLIGGEPIRQLGLEFPAGAMWGAGLFVILAAITSYVIFGFELGIESTDGAAHGFIDLLVDTENELRKVSWPGSSELRRSTSVVLIAIVVLGAFLYVIDLAMMFAMRTIQVLPK